MSLPACLHLDLDGAWAPERVARTIPCVEYLDCKSWGPKLRFITPRSIIEAFYEEVRPQLPPFILYGSGDFHFLTALWLRKFHQPFTLVSFDNHPDWDTRPPHWCCGSWLSRAVELPHLRKATIWGPGNFELEWPNRMYANHRGIRAGRLDVRPWSERLKPRSRSRWASVTRENWREEFSSFAATLTGEKIYVTVDMDCLIPENAATNWENGLFTAEDVAWALHRLNESGEIVSGDLCGAFSPPVHARLFQKIAAGFDHPHLQPVTPEAAAERNFRTLEIIWPELTSMMNHQ